MGLFAMTKILTTFLSVLLVGLSPLFSADERARKKEEVRQELLSIQSALDEMKGGSPEVRFPPKREPEPERPVRTGGVLVETGGEANRIAEGKSGNIYRHIIKYGRRPDAAAQGLDSRPVRSLGR